ncbi:MAG: hypothetical protein OWQ51_11250 [Pyrobaculum arsenaticum]|uniref:Uncharacterized protein n=1 Tax=Pyrobaculum arsenaticum TaxID=121277 RepID=A0A7L4PDK3_9CREN|nr:hypothetical protein [Pyrobaculum arsenaticum]MCY0891524.1 hypothetical protein [Pyrobaculum arsenaticum]NYR16633.1 hypothetical protein [Pyrobaculum arsenaticum]
MTHGGSILCCQERRTVIVEGSKAEWVCATLGEVEEVLKGVGSRSESGVLFY